MLQNSVMWHAKWTRRYHWQSQVPAKHARKPVSKLKEWGKYLFRRKLSQRKIVGELGRGGSVMLLMPSTFYCPSPSSTNALLLGNSHWKCPLKGWNEDGWEFDLDVSWPQTQLAWLSPIPQCLGWPSPPSSFILMQLPAQLPKLPFRKYLTNAYYWYVSCWNCLFFWLFWKFSVQSEICFVFQVNRDGN